MYTYKVIKPYRTEFQEPIRLMKDQIVLCLEESEPEGDWPNWTLCKSVCSQGWVPNQIIKKEGCTGIITEDYSAREFDLDVGETLVAEKILNGWMWGYKGDDIYAKSWAPLNHLEKL